ncbi:MAG: hypothetical protein HC934_07085 [Acaryochloridaceae cyanobacterium SU_2_1]|nr:hypothetical protein [Acaryochloridaceae cyanobacterium SU_2_1]
MSSNTRVNNRNHRQIKHHNPALSSGSSWKRIPAFTTLLALVILGAGCQDTSNPQANETASSTPAATQSSGKLKLVADFPSNVVLPTYDRLVTESSKLVTAVEAFVATP